LASEVHGSESASLGIDALRTVGFGSQLQLRLRLGRLSEQERKQLADWFDELEEVAWDRQIQEQTNKQYSLF